MSERVVDIDCGVCRIRGWRSGDERSIVEHANDYDVWRNLRDRFPHPYTQKDADSWVRYASSQVETNLAIAVDGAAVGSIGFELREDVERISAEIGYWLGQQYWGRGIVTAALKAATSFAMKRFVLSRIYALPFADNAASIRVLEKAGYRLEGTLRRSAIKEGVIKDQLLYAITDLDLAEQT
jgi:RimJ/RimL family protein N-acetyltransferase